MKGRKPQPTEEKRRRGNPGKRRLNDHEPQFPTVPAEYDLPPSELQGDVAACAEWIRLAPQLRISRMMTEADRGALLALCQQWSIYQDARSKTTSLVVTTKTGHPMPNPYLSVANKALGLCVKLWAELGCTPSSRSRVKTSDEPLPIDPIEEMLGDEDHATTH